MSIPTKGWILTRAELVIGAACVLVAGVVAAGFTAPMFGFADTGLVRIVVGLGVAGTIIGLAWMVRIVRRDPEAGAPPWRHRSR